MERIRICLIGLCWCVLNAAEARASVEDELKTMKADMAAMQGRMNALEEKVSQQDIAKQNYEHHIKELESQLAAQPQPAVAVQPQNRLGLKWTPEIGAVADTVVALTSSKEDAEGNNRLSLRELELVVGSNVDPFSRLDSTISFSDTENPALEEAYLTRFGLPFTTTARVGKFKPKVGKMLPVHRDSIDTVDEPLVIQRYFGAEGFNKSGVDLTKTFDLPIPVTQQVAVGILEGGNGEGGAAFGTARRAPTLYAHLKNYLDLTDDTGLEVGLSEMSGSRDDMPNFGTRILATDTTLIHHLSPHQDIKLQAEAFNLERTKTIDADGNLWGAYGLLDFRFHPQWSTGFRYDYVELVNNPADNPQKDDNAYTGYLTFYQSEFARWRAQFTHANLATGKDDNTVYLQGTFAIGDHKHKLQ